MVSTEIKYAKENTTILALIIQFIEFINLDKEKLE